MAEAQPLRIAVGNDSISALLLRPEDASALEADIVAEDVQSADISANGAAKPTPRRNRRAKK